MSTYTLLFLLSLVVTTSVTVAQSRFDAVRESSQTFVGSIAEYTHDQRTALVDVSKEALNKIDELVTLLDARMRNHWHKMSETNKEQTQKAMTELKIQRLVVAEAIGALGYGSSEQWSDIKVDFQSSFDTLLSSLDHAIEKTVPE